MVLGVDLSTLEWSEALSKRKLEQYHTSTKPRTKAHVLLVFHRAWGRFLNFGVIFSTASVLGVLEGTAGALP